jgi:hypothetical protein
MTLWGRAYVTGTTEEAACPRWGNTRIKLEPSRPPVPNRLTAPREKLTSESTMETRRSHLGHESHASPSGLAVWCFIYWDSTRQRHHNPLGPPPSAQPQSLRGPNSAGLSARLIPRPDWVWEDSHSTSPQRQQSPHLGNKGALEPHSTQQGSERVRDFPRGTQPGNCRAEIQGHKTCPCHLG